MRASAAFQRLCDKAPSAFFERSIPGVRMYSLPTRFGCLGVKFLEYSLGGLLCGVVGQSIANGAMLLRRAQHPDATYTVDPPPILQTALVWGLFMGVSSNIRYQAVFGLERLVDMTIAKRVPQVRRLRHPAVYTAPVSRNLRCARAVLLGCTLCTLLG
jgi:Protein RETICULATA-related